MPRTLKKTDLVLLRDTSGKTYLTRAVPELIVNTSFGMVNADKLVGKSFGDKVETSSGHFVQLLKPSFADIFHRLKRGPQIITLKDASIISAYAGIRRGDRIVEGGAGSGALTVYLANLVAPEGRVYSYEVRDDFFALAKSNLDFVGLSDFVELKLADIYEGISESEADSVILDVPEPWRALDTAANALIAGGTIVSYLPTTNQVQQLASAIYNNPAFAPLSVREVIVRDYQTLPHAIRPKSQGLMHTAYLCFSRRV